MKNLSSRETQICQLAARGMRNQQIADELSISLYTVKNHMKAIFLKLQIGKRSQLKQSAQAAQN